MTNEKPKAPLLWISMADLSRNKGEQFFGVLIARSDNRDEDLRSLNLLFANQKIDILFLEIPKKQEARFLKFENVFFPSKESLKENFPDLDLIDFTGEEI